MARGNRTIPTLVHAPAPAAVAQDQMLNFNGRDAVSAVRNAQPIVAAYQRRLHERLAAQPGAFESTTALIDAQVEAAGIISASEQRALAAAAKVSRAAHHGRIEVDGMTQRGSEEALELLMLANHRAAAVEARRYRGQGLDFEELKQETTVGFIRAVEKYDFRDQATFLTYAKWWMRDSVNRAVQKTGDAIPIPNYLRTVTNQVRQVFAEADSHYLNAPEHKGDLADVASHNGLDMETIRIKAQEISGREIPLEHIEYAVEHLGRSVVSMDTTANDDENFALVNRLADTSTSADEAMWDEQVKASVEKAMAKALRPAEMTMVERIYGLNGHQPTSLRELEKELGTARSTISRQMQKAMERLRIELERDGISIDLFA